MSQTAVYKSAAMKTGLKPKGVKKAVEDEAMKEAMKKTTATKATKATKAVYQLVAEKTDLMPLDVKKTIVALMNVAVDALKETGTFTLANMLKMKLFGVLRRSYGRWKIAKPAAHGVQTSPRDEEAEGGRQH